MNAHTAPTHVMQVMDPTGHTSITWNPDVEDSIAEAKREFNHLINRGYKAFKMSVSHDGRAVVEEKGDRIDTFDPTAGKILMIPHLVGG